MYYMAQKVDELEAARRALRMAERELSEINGQRKIVEEQLVLARADLSALGVAEDNIAAHLALLETELATIEQELAAVEEIVEEKLVALEA